MLQLQSLMLVRDHIIYYHSTELNVRSCDGLDIILQGDTFVVCGAQEIFL